MNQGLEMKKTPLVEESPEAYHYIFTHRIQPEELLLLSKELRKVTMGFGLRRVAHFAHTFIDGNSAVRLTIKKTCPVTAVDTLFDQLSATAIVNVTRTNEHYTKDERKNNSGLSPKDKKDREVYERFEDVIRRTSQLLGKRN